MPRSEGSDNCPICTGLFNYEDLGTVDKKGRRVICQGKVMSVHGPVRSNVPPFGSRLEYNSGYYTVILQLSVGKDCRKYLKFPDEKSLTGTGLYEGDKVRVEGCLHQADNKELIFDVKLLKRFAEPL